MTVIVSSIGFLGQIRAHLFDGDLPPFASSELTQFLDGRWSDLWDSLHIRTDRFSNLTTNVGRQQLTKVIVAETTVGVGYVGLSTAVIVPALTDATLPNEAVVTRKVVAVKQSLTLAAAYYQRYVGYFTTTDFSSTAINAAALFDTASTGGNMFNDASVTISKPNTTSLTLDWRVLSSTG